MRLDRVYSSATDAAAESPWPRRQALGRRLRGYDTNCTILQPSYAEAGSVGRLRIYVSRPRSSACKAEAEETEPHGGLGNRHLVNPGQIGCASRKPDMNSVGQPDAANPHVRFDDRGRETEPLAKPERHRALPRLYWSRVKLRRPPPSRHRLPLLCKNEPAAAISYNRHTRCR